MFLHNYDSELFKLALTVVGKEQDQSGDLDFRELKS